MKRNLFLFFLAGIVTVQPLAKLFICINFGIHQEFIAKKICEKRTIKNNKCKGKCHLRKQLKAADSEEKNDKSATSFNFMKFSEESLSSEANKLLSFIPAYSILINTEFQADLLCLPNPPDSEPPELFTA